MQRFITKGVEALGDREVGVIASTSELARDGHVIVPSGISLTNYRKNPVVLWNHDVDQPPVGVCTAIGLQDGSLAARIEFAPAGVSDLADEVCGLVKAGTIRAVSIGFDPIDGQLLDPQKPREGFRITESELYEISFCAVPVDTGAAVVARSISARPAAMATLRSLSRNSADGIRRALSMIAQPRSRQRNERSPTMFRRNMDAITAAQAHAEQAFEAHRAAGRHHSEMADAMERLSDHHRALGTALRSYRRALQDGDTETAVECQNRCNRSLSGIKRESRILGDRHDDATEAHEALTRALSDTDSQLIQSSGGTSDDQGSRSYRQRQAAIRRFEKIGISHSDPGSSYARRQAAIARLSAAGN